MSVVRIRNETDDGWYEFGCYEKAETKTTASLAQTEIRHASSKGGAGREEKIEQAEMQKGRTER